MPRAIEMIETSLSTRAPLRRAARLGRVAAVIIAAGLASACTALPEWADPGGWLSDDVPPPTEISAAKNLDQAQSGDFPKLSSVPEQPRQASTAAERADAAAGLAADRSNARYSGQHLTAGGLETPANAPAAPAVAQQIGAVTTQAPQVSQAPATAVPAPRQIPASSIVSTPPAAAPAQPMPAPSASDTMAQVVVTPPPQAPQPPPRSELAAVIYFADGSDDLNANDRAVLRDIVALSRERNARVRVIGHASARTRTVDPIEHRVVNLEISQRRADAVANSLISMGLPRERVRVEAQADAQPIYHEFMPTGEAGNRRAEIFLEY
jgi:outer membrane protein OmpA-like peptidoglycan-associated protein